MQLATFYDHMKDMAREEKIGLTEALQYIKSLGITHMEVSQNNLLGREDEVGRELSFVGLEISSIPAYFDFGRDDNVDRQSQPVLEAARYLGAGKILVIPGFFQEGDSPEEKSRQMESMARCLNRLGEKAAGYGVSLVMEDYDSLLAPFSTAEGLEHFLSRCPGLSCCFDTGNFRFAGEDELAAYEKLKSRISHVHLKDRAYSPQWGEHAAAAADGQLLYPAPVGKGEIPIAGLLSRLAADGYEGVCTIEHYGAKSMRAALQESAAWLRENFPFA